MRMLLVALACALLVACGGDDGDSPPIITKFNTSQTALKVMLPGYEGYAIVEVDGTPHFVSGSAVHQLGVFPEGTDVEVSLIEWEEGYHCWPTNQRAILVDVSLTVMYHCTKDDSPTRPMITSISYPVAVPVNELESISVTAESPTGSPVLGFKLDVVSAPDGATFTHETPNTSSQYQYFRMDTPGEYVIEIRAVTTAGLSYPFTITLKAKDPAPIAYFRLTPAKVYTDTDVLVTSDIFDNDPSSVTLTHVWYINDVQVPDVDGDTLPSNLFKKGDRIGVELIVRDPFNEITTSRDDVTVLDSPAELDTSNIPAQINRGMPLSVDLVITDKDLDDTPAASLAYGPKGMEINNNTLQWQVDPILISDAGLFHFGVALSENPDDTQELTIEVIDSGRKSITVAPPGTTVDRLTRANQLLDYDNDGVKEAINVSSTYMTITNMVSGEVEWAVNALGRDRTQYMKDAVFVPREGQTGLVAVLSDHVELIDPATGKTLARRHLNTLETNSAHSGYTINHVSGATPGEGFVVVSMDSGKQLVALDQHTLEVKWRTIVGNISEIAVVANFDTDPQDEIVTKSGYVFDGESGANQWLYEAYTYFHTLYQEDLGYSLGVYRGTGDTIRLVDFHNKSYTDIGSGISSYRTIGTGNMDADPDDELIIVGYSDTTVFDYDGSSQSFAANGTYPVPYTQNMAVVRDFTENNKASIVGSSGTSLSIHDIVTDTSWRNLNHRCGEQYSFFSPTDADNNQTSVSVAVNCRNDENIHVPFLVSIDAASKDITYTESASHNASALLTGLIDNDINPDTVTGNSSTITVRDIAIGADTWSIASPNTKHALMAMDINDDGVKEIFSRNAATIDIYDIVSESILGQTIPASSGQSSYIYSAELFIDASSNSQYLAVGKGNQLELYGLDENGVSLLRQKSVSALSDIALIDYDADGTMEIAVLRDTYNQDLIDIFDLRLDPVAQISIPDGVVKLASYPDTGSHLLGVRRSSYGKHVLEIDLGSGKATWESPIIFGSNSSIDYQKLVDVSESVNGLHLRIIAGFSAVIAW